MNIIISLLVLDMHRDVAVIFLLDWQIALLCGVLCLYSLDLNFLHHLALLGIEQISFVPEAEVCRCELLVDNLSSELEVLIVLEMHVDELTAVNIRLLHSQLRLVIETQVQRDLYF